MNSTKFDHIWRLMSQYRLQLAPDQESKDLLCTLCSNLLNDSYQSACGCQYCHKCIVVYLDGKEKHCPGGKLECEEEHLVMEMNVSRSMLTHSRILKSRVICPIDSCRSEIELSQMVDHLRVCEAQLSTCPYGVVGCDTGVMKYDSLLDHIHDHALSHSEHFVNYVLNLRNEVEMILSENDALRNELKMNKLMNKNLNERIDDLCKASKREMNIQFERIDKKIGELYNEIVKGRQIMISDVQEKMKEITSMIDEHKEEQNKIILDQRGEIEGRDLEITDFRDVLHTVCNNVDDLRVEIEKSNVERDKRTNIWIKWNKLLPYVNVDFVWKVDQLSQKNKGWRRKELYSEPFYSDNYMLCLRMNIVEDNIGLYCHIMKGEVNEEVEWPMMKDTTIGIINQRTFEVHKSVTFKYDEHIFVNKYAYEEPRSERNFGIGDYSFILYSSIKNDSSVVVDDTLIVFCFLRNR